MNREDVYKEIDKERDYQTEKWGSDDLKYTTIEGFTLYMQHHLQKGISLASTTSNQEGKQLLLAELRKVTALGIACFEQFGVPSREDTLTK